MKFSCEKAILQTAVTTAGRVVAPKSSIQALEGVLIEAGDGSLSISGYNLETGIVTTAPAEVTEDGAIVLSARLFGEILRRMPDDVVSIGTENCSVHIQCGPTSFDIMGSSDEDFPELPSVSDGTSLSITQGNLRSMISQTIFAVSDNESRPIHTGALFEAEEGELTMVAVDGYRLALRRESSLYQGDLSFIVPGKTMGELSKLLKDEEDELAQIAVAGKHIFFTLNDCFLFSRLLEGEFLDYEKAIPSSHKTQVTIDVRRLTEGLERVSLLIADRLRSPVRCGFAGETVKLSCQTSMGGAVDLIDVETEGEEVEIGFNSKYFVDALKAAGCEKAKLLLSGPLSPMTIVPKDGDKFLFLVLPVRLS